MKRSFILSVCLVWAMLLLAEGCSHNAGDKRLIGEWKSDSITLKITEKQFTFDSPTAEDYFVKGDTIYTSFEGNLPYTKYAIKSVDDHHLEIFTPDSELVSFTK